MREHKNLPQPESLLKKCHKILGRCCLLHLKGGGKISKTRQWAFALVACCTSTNGGWISRKNLKHLRCQSNVCYWQCLRSSSIETPRIAKVFKESLNCREWHASCSKTENSHKQGKPTTFITNSPPLHYIGAFLFSLTSFFCCFCRIYVWGTALQQKL